MGRKGPLSTDGVYQIMRRLGQLAGVSRYNPHSFRHRLVKCMVKNGAPHKVIQDLMGWNSAKMVQIYVVHTAEELQHHHDMYT